MINWNRVSELRDEVGQEDFDEVVELFLDEVETAIANLGDELDADALASLLHFLKGSALNLGFEKFAKLCAAREKSASNGQNDKCDLEEIRQCYQSSRTEFITQLRQFPAA